ncbi:MAG: zinc dependent phospholipase C family protein [Clostridia bacterium]|nr:zinc dependent phospholipase C family protein [Clostridia bacterium]
MPAVYAHCRFGEELISYLPPSLQKGLEPYMDAFRLGTQGPDILFYHKPLKSNPLRKKGSDMHRKAGKSFFLRQAKRLLTENLVKKEGDGYVPDSADAAYIAGFLCHFLLDVRLHPTVYEAQATGLAHGKIESELEKYMLRKDGKPTRGYNTASPFGNERSTAKACAAALDAKEEEAARAIKTIQKLNGWFTSKNGALHAAAHTGLSLVGLNKKFGSMFLHKKDDPHCKETVEALARHWQEALPFAAKIVEEYFHDLAKNVENGELDPIFAYTYAGEKCQGTACEI